MVRIAGLPASARCSGKSEPPADRLLGMARAAAAWLCVVALCLAVSAGAGAVGGAGTGATTTKPDPTVTKNDFKGWIPIALGGALVVAVAITRVRRRR